MLIKDLILALNTLYNTYDDEYKAIAGEPEIMVDVFKKDENHRFTYEGFGKDIVIEKTDDGVYNVISTFSTSQAEKPVSTGNSSA